jgi:hypothetical protein
VRVFVCVKERLSGDGRNECLSEMQRVLEAWRWRAKEGPRWTGRVPEEE